MLHTHVRAHPTTATERTAVTTVVPSKGKRHAFYFVDEFIVRVRLTNSSGKKKERVTQTHALRPKSFVSCGLRGNRASSARDLPKRLNLAHRCIAPDLIYLREKPLRFHRRRRGAINSLTVAVHVPPVRLRLRGLLCVSVYLEKGQNTRQANTNKTQNYGQPDSICPPCITNINRRQRRSSKRKGVTHEVYL